jgi:hypothetical protein
MNVHTTCAYVVYSSGDQFLPVLVSPSSNMVESVGAYALKFNEKGLETRAAAYHFDQLLTAFVLLRSIDKAGLVSGMASRRKRSSPSRPGDHGRHAAITNDSRPVDLCPNHRMPRLITVRSEIDAMYFGNCKPLNQRLAY